ncbi:TIGR02444 family protein [Bosea rubneri]|uniref:TIGR02444 family protein n=1 Tax=Bosea rubneri TaxID=3075434 RepID=A0ABU3SCQ9_9HYPH|nr:TIGR02444 family protein [Bosea sp. ZW T0_25]MDU0342571.1 TIGR02444 family protein [Bosea sp. ZW T0_25]
MSKLDLDGQLWRFALEFYALPGVAEACLTLQDQADVDVIELLAAIYAERVLLQPLSSEDVADLHRQTAEWRGATVLPLREIRRVLKPPRDGFPEERHLLREKVKAAELLAEQIQLAITEQWLGQRAAKSGLSIREVFALIPKDDAAGQPRNERAIGIALSALETAMEHVIRNCGNSKKFGDQ